MLAAACQMCQFHLFAQKKTPPTGTDELSMPRKKVAILSGSLPASGNNRHVHLTISQRFKEPLLDKDFESCIDCLHTESSSRCMCIAVFQSKEALCRLMSVVEQDLPPPQPLPYFGECCYPI